MPTHEKWDNDDINAKKPLNTINLQRETTELHDIEETAFKYQDTGIPTQYLHLSFVGRGAVQTR